MGISMFTQLFSGANVHKFLPIRPSNGELGFELLSRFQCKIENETLNCILS